MCTTTSQATQPRLRLLGWRSGCALALSALLSSTARAAPYDYVLLPYFEAGQWRASADWGTQQLDSGHAQGEALTLGYAPTSFWYTEAWGTWESQAGSPTEFGGGYWTNEIALPSLGRADWAIAATYWKPNFGGSGYAWTVGPMFQFAADHFDLNLNLFATHWLWPGRPLPATLSYQAQIKTLLAPGWEWGAQALGDLGRVARPGLGGQSQELGPALFAHRKIGPGSVHFDLALLAGLNDSSARTTLRAQLAYSF